MATAAQISANRLNSSRSTGPTSPAGKQASSRNRATHGLSQHTNESFYLLADEDREKFSALRARLAAEHQPQTETECILVRRMADHEWLRTRALRLEQTCIFEDQPVLATEQFALYLRYQTTHERAFYKAFAELQKLQAAKSAKAGQARLRDVPSAEPVLRDPLPPERQIGFESQKHPAAAAALSARADAQTKESETA